MRKLFKILGLLVQDVRNQIVIKLVEPTKKWLSEKVGEPISELYETYLKKPIKSWYAKKIQPITNSISRNFRKVAGLGLNKEKKESRIGKFFKTYLINPSNKYIFSPVSTFYKSSISNPYNQWADDKIKGFENRSKQAMERLFPEIKEEIREALKKEWETQVQKKIDLEAKREAEAKQNAETPGHDAEESKESSRVMVKDKPYEGPYIRAENFSVLFNEAVTIELKQNVRGYQGGRVTSNNFIAVVIRSDFLEQCEKDGVANMRDSLQTPVTKFLKSKGYNVKSYNPGVTSEILPVETPDVHLRM